MIYYVDWLFKEPPTPIKCIGGKAYEIAYQGKIKMFHEKPLDKCEETK